MLPFSIILVHVPHEKKGICHLAYKNWRKVADLILMHYFKLILASTERSHNLSTLFFDKVPSHILTVDILNPGPTVYILDRSVIAIVVNEASMF